MFKRQNYSILTEEELCDKLKSVREILTNLRNRCKNRIIFINLESLLTYIEYYELNGSSEFSDLLYEIEPFIPLTVTDENVEQYLLAAVDDDETKLGNLENSFTNSSKTKFILAILQSKNEEDFSNILEVCKTVRQYKEEDLLKQTKQKSFF